MSMSRRDVELAMRTQIKPINPVVFYDPRKPDRSCLVAGPTEMTLVGPIVGSVLVVALLFFRGTWDASVAKTGIDVAEPRNA